MLLNSYAEVTAFITKILTDNGQYDDAKNSRHMDFWSTSYQDLTQGNVPNIRDADGNPIRILIPGNSKDSTIIHALKGTGLFDPRTGLFGRMPDDGPPYFTDDQIQQIADWIDANCPN
jgi:hypothetical protein